MLENRLEPARPKNAKLFPLAGLEIDRERTSFRMRDNDAILEYMPPVAALERVEMREVFRAYPCAFRRSKQITKPLRDSHLRAPILLALRLDRRQPGLKRRDLGL